MALAFAPSGAAWTQSVARPAPKTISRGASSSAPAPAVGKPAQALAGAVAGLSFALLGSKGSKRLSRAARRVLPDGTNEEGEDLQKPLNIALADVKDVKLYGNEFSPPCKKIQTMLDFYGVPFEMVKGRHPTSDYKKIPVLEISGRQVNDSHVIVKNLVPVLTGSPFSEEAAAWEKRITFEFQPSIEVELFGNGGDFAKVAGIEGIGALAIQALGPLLGLLIGAVFRSRYGEFPSSADFGKEFLKACGEKSFFHGEAPGPVDLSLYGTYAGLAQKKSETVESFLNGSGLRPWHERMQQAASKA